MAYNNNNPFKATRSARYTAAAPSSSRYAAAGPSSSRYQSETASTRSYAPFMPLTGGAALGLSANYTPPRASSTTRGLILPRSPIAIAPVRTQVGRPERRRALATHEGSSSAAEGQKHTHLSAYEYREGTSPSSSPSNNSKISPDRIGSPWRCPHLPPIGRQPLRSPQSQDDYGLGYCIIGAQAGDGADAPVISGCTMPTVRSGSAITRTTLRAALTSFVLAVTASVPPPLRTLTHCIKKTLDIQVSVYGAPHATTSLPPAYRRTYGQPGQDTFFLWIYSKLLLLVPAGNPSRAFASVDIGSFPPVVSRHRFALSPIKANPIAIFDSSTPPSPRSPNPFALPTSPPFPHHHSA
ncbi:unnamed protein product [Tilletia controversa]|nr:unnamed protein product [Tilletia controversa]